VTRALTADIGLGISLVATGLWSGLLLTLTTILHPMYAPRDARGFVEDMRRFLPIARRSPTNYILAGPLLTSRWFAEPNYEVILAWDPEAVPRNWRDARARYFRLNWIRAALTWSAFALFAAATYLYLT